MFAPLAWSLPIEPPLVLLRQEIRRMILLVRVVVAGWGRFPLPQLSSQSAYHRTPSALAKLPAWATSGPSQVSITPPARSLGFCPIRPESNRSHEFRGFDAR